MTDLLQTQLEIDPEISRLCRKLTDEEYAQLEANLLKDGCRDPIVIWGRIPLDGHNRHEICLKHKIPHSAVQVKGVTTREEALAWVIKNQLGRRNLNKDDFAYLVGKRYALEKQSHGGDRRPSGQSDHLKTAQVIAEQHGTSEKTVRRVEPFAQAVDVLASTCGEKAAEEIRSGRSRLSHERVVELARLPRRSQAKAYRQAKLEAQKPRKRPAKQKLTPPAAGPVSPAETSPAIAQARAELEAPVQDQPPWADGKPKPPAGKPVNRVMSGAKGGRLSPDEPPDPVVEVTRLNAAWEPRWLERYCAELRADQDEEAARRKCRAREHLGALISKLMMLANACDAKRLPGDDAIVQAGWPDASGDELRTERAAEGVR